MDQSLHYAGFWKRLAASVIDMVVITVVIALLLWMVYGEGYLERSQPVPGDLSGLFLGPADALIQLVVPVILLFVFWKYRSATPGKMLLSLKIVDARTGKAPSTAQLVGRFFAYLVSTLPLGLGFLWIGFDRRKQGWHDKLAGTVVITERNAREGTNAAVARPGR